MPEFIIVVLVMLCAGLAWLYRNTQQAHKQVTHSLEQLRATLQQTHIPVQDSENALRSRDAAIKELQSQPFGAPASTAESVAELDIIQQLKARTTLQSSLLDAIAEGLVVINHNLQVIEFNAVAATIFKGIDRGRLLKDVAEDWPGIVALTENALSYHDVGVEEQMVIGQSNFLVRVSYAGEESAPLVTIILEDITQLVRLNRARRDMVANISHELRHPIANIRLIIDGLFHEQDKPKRKESISSLRQIAHETDLLLWLVQAMHDLSMIESGQAIIKMVECNLSELVDVALERLSGQVERRNVNITRHIPTKIQVLCDRDLIQRVIFNLVHNAIKWSPEGGAITLGAEVSGDEVILNVYDSGPGVPPGQVERIFERFYQVDPSRSGKEGTGLGLAISKHIIEAHGGRVWAEPNLHGQGGRFRFTLLNATPALEPIARSSDELHA